VFVLRWLLLLFVGWVGFFPLQAQNLDSLRTLIRSEHRSDTARILTLTEYAYELRRMLPDSSLMLAQQALAQADQLHYVKGKGRALRIIGISHYLRSEYKTALGFYEQSLQFSLQAKDVKNIANCYNNIGTIYHGQSEYTKAAAIFQKSMYLREQINDQRGIAQVHANLASVYQDQSEYAEALSHFQQALTIYERINDKEGVASAYRNIGTVNWNFGNTEEALRYFLLSLEKRKDMPDDKYGMSFLLNDLGNVYKERGNYEKALEYFFSALKIQEETGSKQGIAASYTNIGNIYRDQGNYEKALGYLTNSLKIKQEIGSKTGIANSYSEIGSVYMDRNQLKEATDNFLKSLEIRSAVGDRSGVALACSRLAQIFIQTRDFPKALSFLERGMKIGTQVKSNPVLCNLYIGYATYYNATGNHTLAYDYAIKAYAIADKMNSIDYMRSAVGQKLLAAEKLGNYKEALDDHKLFLRLNDSIENLNSIKKSLALEYLFKEEKSQIEAEKKELELRADTERQKRITYTFAGVAIAFIVISLLVFRSSRQNKKANNVLVLQKQEIEKVNDDLAKADTIKNRLLSIISHDVRGPLNSLKGVLYLFNNNAMSQEELKDATASVSDQVLHLNHFLDNLLRWSKSQMNEVEPDRQRLSVGAVVADSVALMSFSALAKKLDVQVKVPAELTMWADEEMIKCVLRNLLANAIKFCDEKDRIHITAEPIGSCIRIVVEDTGIGIAPEQLPLLFGISHLSTKGTHDEVGTGLGLVLCKEFVEKNGGEIAVSSEPGKGSVFSFTVPAA
jgi:signal transduction histidine kinase/uncharacterized protein HemY